MNILMDTRGNPYVIDWTAATIGDPRIDAAWSPLLARLHTGGAFSNSVLDNMDYFIVDACLRRLSDILISLDKGPEFLGMREGALTEMRRNIALLGMMYDAARRTTGIAINELEKQVKRHSVNPK